MKLLVLPRYGRLGASSRLRMMQYLPYLEVQGMDVTLAPLFPDTYVAGLQHNRRNLREVVRAYTQRIKTLRSSSKFDLIWIEKEALPWLPAWLERLLLTSKVPYVLDYDDAVFHYYDQHRSALVQHLLGQKHKQLIRDAAFIVAGSAYLAGYAAQSGAKNVELVPTVIDLVRYPQTTHAQSTHPSNPPRVGWIGQRATASFLLPYQAIFARLSSSGVARFVAIGIDAEALGLPMESVSWAEETEVASIASLDIGIMPLVDGPFERGKCGYKLIQYMACGLPVVASPVGVNCQIVEHGVNGFLAETPEQWEHALRTLLADAPLRHRMGLAGRHKVEQHYCLQVAGPRLVELLSESAKR
jgi:glycosyltransferase involved in cell wall biosynthesis